MIELANLLYPDINETIESINSKFPKRKEGFISRFAPSPTGFLHIGGVYSCMISSIFCKNENGKFFLRIEDTDQKRSVEGAIDKIINGLKTVGITFDEGPIGELNSDIGEYGPYIQSKRVKLYDTFAKELISKGLVYPCFMQQEEIEKIRNLQESRGEIPGIYGNYARSRNLTIEEIKEKIKKGEKYVIRIKGHGKISEKIKFNDEIRGEIEMQDNFQDTVLIKSDGIPTYHFAHLVDDYLMGTTHVIRGDERLASVPLHILLFKICGLEHPKYCHLAPILTLENGNKRKLSKRKDPESDIEYFFAEGYDSVAILEYLMSIADSGFEEWKNNNPDLNLRNYKLFFSKISKSGALFDIQKLNNIGKETLSKKSDFDLYNQLLNRSSQYDEELKNIIINEKNYIINVLGIERNGENNPKRFTKLKDVREHIKLFSDYYFDKSEKMEISNIPNHKEILKDYIEKLNLNQTKEERFEELKSFGEKRNFAKNNQDFKSGNYIGKIGDLAMLLRVKLFNSTTTPDLYESLKAMGLERVTKRLSE